MAGVEPFGITVDNKLEWFPRGGEDKSGDVLVGREDWKEVPLGLPEGREPSFHLYSRSRDINPMSQGRFEWMSCEGQAETSKIRVHLGGLSLNSSAEPRTQ